MFHSNIIINPQSLRLSFTHHILPPSLPTQFLKVVADIDNAYIVKNLGNDYTDIWVSCSVGFDAACLAVWDVGPDCGLNSGKFFDLMNEFDSAFAGPYYYPCGGEIWWGDNGAGASPSPVPPTSQWFPMEMHYYGAGIQDFYINGSLVYSSVSGTGSIINRVRFGQFGGVPFDSNIVVYFKNIKIGTNRGAIDIFSNNFSSGDFSSWDITSGNVSIIVDDPFPELQSSPGLYGWLSSSHHLVSIDKTTGAGTGIGVNSGINGAGLDFNSGIVYLVGQGTLYTVNTSTGFPTEIIGLSGANSSGNMTAASFYNNILYAVNQGVGTNRTLVTIDINTGIVTTIGATLSSADALAWANGILYAAQGSSQATSNLYIINPNNGSATSIGPIGYALTGLAFDSTTSIMYGSVSNNSSLYPRYLITVDINTGAGTLIGQITNISFDAAQDITVVP